MSTPKNNWLIYNQTDINSTGVDIVVNASDGGAPAEAKWGIFTINHTGGQGRLEVWCPTDSSWGNMNHVVGSGIPWSSYRGQTGGPDGGTHQFLAPVINGKIYFHTKMSGSTSWRPNRARQDSTRNSGRTFSLYGMGWI